MLLTPYSGEQLDAHPTKAGGARRTGSGTYSPKVRRVHHFRSALGSTSRRMLRQDPLIQSLTAPV